MHISKKRSHEQNPAVQKAALASKIHKLLSWVSDHKNIREDLLFIRDNVLAHATSSKNMETVQLLLEPVEQRIKELGLGPKGGEPLKENPFSDST